MNKLLELLENTATYFGLGEIEIIGIMLFSIITITLFKYFMNNINKPELFMNQ